MIPKWLQTELRADPHWKDATLLTWGAPFGEKAMDEAVEVALAKLIYTIETMPSETVPKTTGMRTIGGKHWIGRAEVLVLLRGTDE